MMDWQQNPAVTYGSRILAALRFTGFVVILLLMVPVHLIYSAIKPKDHARLPIIFHRILLRLIGFKVRVHGAMSTAKPVFFVANHTSYLDIPVLGSLIPASFVAKAEVASWPLFGFLAKLQNTIFIERRQTRAVEQRDQLTQCLAEGRNLIIFPEGTSSEGRYVLPFKSSLFSVIETASEDIEITVQPVSISCTAIDGLPLTQNLRSYYSWYGDMTLLPHLWQAFKCDRFTIDVIFHPPIHARDIPDRKKLALFCQAAVGRGVEQCVTGRWGESEQEPAAITAH